MIFRELNRDKCKTYLAICEGTRKAAVIDPLREKSSATSRSSHITDGVWI
jgi:hypothetical protein